MKIFATSDIHGNKTIINKLYKVSKLCDLLLVCGDIGGKDVRSKTFRQFSKYQKEESKYFIDALKSLNISSRFILGNDDWFELEDVNYLVKAESMDGIKLVPFEFVLLTPFNTNREANENKLAYELAKVDADSNTVIVAHTPPLGFGDLTYRGVRVGSKSVREWIEEEQPKIWLNGHIHEEFSVNAIGKTFVFNCACNYTDNMLRGWLIDTDTMGFEKIVIS